jgi:hypothetical protein
LIAGIAVVMGAHDRPFAFPPDHRRVPLVEVVALDTRLANVP